MNLLKRKLSRGFSMIEVLVSMIIIAVGVLGMVALQSKAIPYTQDSVQRNTAIMLVDDLMGIIRSASADCTSANTCIKAPGTDFPAPAASCIPTPATLSSQIGCWAVRAGKALPGGSSLLNGSFYICRSTAPGDTSACTSTNTLDTELEIQVAWTVKSNTDCMVGSASNNTCTYRLRTRIK